MQDLIVGQDALSLRTWNDTKVLGARLDAVVSDRFAAEDK
jgi:hypothetical protein